MRNWSWEKEGKLHKKKEGNIPLPSAPECLASVPTACALSARPRRARPQRHAHMSAEDTSPETGGLQGAGVPATLPSPPNVNGGVMLHSLTYGVVEGAVETGGKKKLKVRACAHCAESHAACNEERPCERCKKRCAVLALPLLLPSLPFFLLYLLFFVAM